MVGQINPNPSDDGADIHTDSEARNGLFVENTKAARAPDSPNAAIGNGLCAVTKVPNSAGVFGANNTDDPGATGSGVIGLSGKGDGVLGITRSSAKNGIIGTNESTDAVPANIPGGNGIFGFSKNSNAAGIHGINGGSGKGVFGFSKDGDGVLGSSGSNMKNGIVGTNDNTSDPPQGVVGGHGVFGFSKNPKAGGVYGHNDGSGPGIEAFSRNGPAGRFLGDIEYMGKLKPTGGVTRFMGDIECPGDIKLVGPGMDCAEDFDISIQGHMIEPGTVMVLNQEGSLKPSCQPYDKKVAGVISGAGGLRPGIVLGKQLQNQESSSVSFDENNRTIKRMPVALMGKVYCKADATAAPIEVGDLLTTSSIEGHAMKATDTTKAFGTVIGKALGPLKEGKGMIPVLVALQ